MGNDVKIVDTNDSKSITSEIAIEHIIANAIKFQG